jgi:hypothetical protein
MNSLPDEVVIMSSNIVTMQPEDPTKKIIITKIYTFYNCARGTNFKEAESVCNISLAFDSQEEAAKSPLIFTDKEEDLLVVLHQNLDRVDIIDTDSGDGDNG